MAVATLPVVTANEIELENRGDAAVSVVGLLRGEDSLARRELACNPECLEVSHGAAGGEVTEVFCPTEHAGDLGDSFDLHFRAGAPAITGVVVGVNRHGQRIGGARHGMRRLEHLPSIQRVEIGVVVAEPPGNGFEDARHGGRVRSGCGDGFEVGQGIEFGFKRLSGAAEQGGDEISGHGDLSPYHR